MVTTKLYGRTGNQMFQISNTISYAKKHGIEYHIPEHTENDKEWPPVFKHLSNPNYNPSLPIVQINEHSHDYQEIPYIEYYKKDSNLILSGYWQSELYFKDIRKEILEAFRFPNVYHKRVCSLHIRRGDYLRFLDKHPVVNEKYLKISINEMIKKTGTLNFHVFSDDIEWCKIFFKNDAPFFSELQFSFSEGNSPLDDLYSIAQCEHHIISNSSFSWWGAWACSNPDKVVISPSAGNWFGSGNRHLSTATLIPDSWIQIKY